MFNLRQYPYLRPVPSAVDPNRCRRDSRKMISENEPTCPQHQSAAHTHTATILALTSMFAHRWILPTGFLLDSSQGLNPVDSTELSLDLPT